VDQKIKGTLAEIGRLGRHSKTRNQDFFGSSPCRWDPYAITNPKTGLPFSDASAWELICDLLETQAHEFQEVVLRKPLGKLAYATVVSIGPNELRVYVKVELTCGRARGRSFHISTERDNDE
jgi:hypothetical protein